MGWPNQSERLDLGINSVEIDRVISNVVDAAQISIVRLGQSILILFFLTISPQRCDSACMNAA
jgi:hypothetical protein